MMKLRVMLTVPKFSRVIPLQTPPGLTMSTQSSKTSTITRAAATQNRLTAALKASLNWVVKHGIIETNPQGRENGTPASKLDCHENPPGVA